MRIPARLHGGAPALGIVLLIVAPGVTLGYFGFRTLAEREQSLRINYTATTVLVRDRLVAELERIDAGVPTPRDAAGLAAIETAAAWRRSPFILGADGSVITARLRAGTLPAPPDPIAHVPRVAAIVTEAEHHEFVRGDLETALRLYRGTVRHLSNGPAGAAAFIRTRVGRTLFKLRRYTDAIAEYEAAEAVAGNALDRHGLPFTAIALLQIVDAYTALKRTGDATTARDRYARFVLEHPWDLDNGYRQHLARVTSDNTASRAAAAAFEEEIAAIDWIRQRVHPRLRQEPAAARAASMQHVLIAGDRPRLVAYRRSVDPPESAPAFFGYELELERLSGDLLALVLQTVDLGNGLHVALARGGQPSGRLDGHGASVLAEVDLLPGVRYWKVTLSDSRGRSIAQLVAYERWTYGALVAGMLAVMAVGVVLTLRASSRATELARAKTDFVSSVSHELKTPLALIRMYGETLESGIVSDPGKRQEFLGIIRRESERLTRLIDNVLDASRIDRGTKRYDLRQHDMVETVRAALEAYRPLFERGGFTVHTAFPHAPISIPLDREAIIQSLVNLFQNAIKYSRAERHVAVAIRSGEGTVAVSVTDRGIGIPAGHIARIFEPYYRVPRSQSDAIAGSGLGLSIVKHAIEAHGGRVDVASAPGEGTTVTLVLPSPAVPAADIPLAAQPGGAEVR